VKEYSKHLAPQKSLPQVCVVDRYSSALGLRFVLLEIVIYDVLAEEREEPAFFEVIHTAPIFFFLFYTNFVQQFVVNDNDNKLENTNF